ncbi:hypothetical protein C7M84_003072 [Penaeus vannamei]|uniref:Uncharacterized protein n=1 Tax=Penaeus vannamei TaxID=6689 RepID=A0A3R7P867_PENVA|nr:hypothetical protein C7M84_003072 [Penaeus vannamei]
MKTAVMVMSVMICAVAAGGPTESQLLHRIQSREGRGLTQARRYVVKRDGTNRLEQAEAAPARASRLVLLLTKAGLEHARRRRAAQADPGVSEDPADRLAEDTPATEFQAATKEGPSADETTTVAEQGTKRKRRRKMRKILGVTARSGMLLRHGNNIVKVRRVKKRRKVPEGEIQGTQLRMGTAKGSGIEIRQGTAAMKGKASGQESAVQGESETGGNTNIQGQEGDGTEGEEDYYYYDGEDTESPGDGAEGQEGDGTEGDQDYYYDGTGGDGADGGDGTGGQEGDGTDGDQDYYYEETDPISHTTYYFAIDASAAVHAPSISADDLQHI